MQREHPTDRLRYEAFVHPIHATEEAAPLRRVADRGESPATFAIVVGVVLAFLVPFAATLIFLAFTIGHFA